MSDRLSVYNAALVLLGNQPLLTLSDNVASRRALDRVWDETLAFMIEGAFWKFACRTDELQTSDTATSQFGYNYVYELPEDYVRIVRISDNNRMRPTLIDFLIEAGFLFCDCTPLYLQYVSNDAAYGYDTGKWPPSFVRALSDELALRAAPHLTGGAAPQIQALAAQAKKSFYIAKGRDAVNQPEAWAPAGRLVRARAGWMRINAQRRTPYI